MKQASFSGKKNLKGGVGSNVVIRAILHCCISSLEKPKGLFF